MRIILVFVLLIGLVLLVATRPAALRMAADQAVAALDGKLVIEGLEGALFSPLSVARVRWQDAGTTVEVQDTRLDLTLEDLLRGRLNARELSVGTVDVELPPAPTEPSASEPVVLPERIALPLPVSLQAFSLDRLQVRRAGTELVRVEQLKGTLDAHAGQVSLTGLESTVQAGGVAVAIRGSAVVEPFGEYRTEAGLDLNVDGVGPEPLPLRVQAKGPLQKLVVDARSNWIGAQARVETEVDALATQPVRQVHVDLSGLDLARYQAGLPTTGLDLTGLVTLSAPGEGPAVQAKVDLTNDQPGALDAQRIPLSTLHGEVAVQDGGVIAIRALKLDGPAGTLTGSGSVGAADFDVVLESPALQLRAIQGTLVERTVALKARARKAPAKAGLGVDFDVQAGDPEVDARVVGRFADGWVELSQGDVMLRDPAGKEAGSARIAGKAQVAEPFALDVNARLERFDPTRLAEMPPTLLNGTVRASGQLGSLPGVQPVVPGAVEARIALENSRFRDLPLQGTLTARADLGGMMPTRLHTVAGDLSLGSNRLKLDGALGREADALSLRAQIDDARTLVPEVGGALTLESTLRGPILYPRALASATLKDVSVVAGGNLLRLAGGTVDLDLPRLDEVVSRPVKAIGRLSGLVVQATDAPRSADPMVSMASVVLNAEGTLRKHTIALRGEGTGQLAELTAGGSLSPEGIWKGTLSTLGLRHPLLRMPGRRGDEGVQLLEPVQMTAGADRATASPIRLGFAGARAEVTRLDYQRGQLTTALSLAGLPVAWAQRFAALPMLFGASGRNTPRTDLMLGAEAEFSGRVDDLSARNWKGLLRVRREAGDLVVTTETVPEGAAPADGASDAAPAAPAAAPARKSSVQAKAGLSDLMAEVRLAERVLNLQLSVRGERIGTIAATGRSSLGSSGAAALRQGPFWREAVLAASPLTGRFQLDVPSFKWVAPMIGDSWRVDGELGADVQLAGSLSAPQLLGEVTGKGLRADELTNGLRLRDGEMEARLDGMQVDVRKVLFRSGKGEVELSGLLQPPAAGESNARVELRSFPIPLDIGQRVVMSGAVMADMRGADMKLHGRIVADEGSIELSSVASGAPTLSDDVVVLKPDGSREVVKTREQIAREERKSRAERSPLKIDTAIDVDLGKNFRIFGMGLDSRVEGVINVGGTLPANPRATGTLNLRDARFQIYGRRLEVQRGRIIFNGPLADPSLDIVAIRPFMEVEPGVEISGTANVPQVKLTSKTDLSDPERLSWLVLGVPLEEAAGAGQMLALTAAADSIMGDSDSKYADSFTSKVGIDSLSLKDADTSGAAGGSQQETVVSVGKRLGKNLFVTYERSLRGLYNILKLQYGITDRMSLTLQAGSDSAVDLLYYFPFK